MRLVARATLAALILNGCAAPAGGGAGYRQGMPAACYAPKPDPTGYLSAAQGRDLNAGWYQMQAACIAGQTGQPYVPPPPAAEPTRMTRRDVEGSLRLPSALAAELVLSPERRRGVAKKAIETPWAKPRKGRDA